MSDRDHDVMLGRAALVGLVLLFKAGGACLAWPLLVVFVLWALSRD